MAEVVDATEKKVVKVPNDFADRIEAATILKDARGAILLYWEATSSVIDGHLNKDNVLQLVKFVFGAKREAYGDLTWIKQIYHDFDPIFSMNEDSNRELLRQLFAAILMYSMENGEDLAINIAKSIVTSSMSGLRSINVGSPIIEMSVKLLSEYTVDSRSRPDFDEIAITELMSDSDSEIIATKGESDDIEWKNQLLKTLSRNSSKIRSETYELHYAVEEYLSFLDEEVNVLWWTLNGYSDLFESPFTALDKFSIIMTFGIEIADMVPNGVEQPCIRNLMTKAGLSTEKVKLTEFISHFSGKELEIKFEKSCATLQPILYCLNNAINSSSDNWIEESSLCSEIEISELDLAIQLNREYLGMNE